ncbi:NAD(P)H-dependent oxidoreductase [Bacillus cereus]|uniref:NAD(P)H-dependent oxidoreductase n=1 Tax=Bacillus cereus TaxID=1396 RepID=UPI000BEC87B5|nr:NAD(P)H-dependent oxidoreductase [Bacillus cereus]PEF61714.1 NAD(P)H-dependent oxidoreductase [Bacillus cereus]
MFDKTQLKEQILHAHQFRRAIKKFNPSKKINESDFQFILEVGRLSPSSFGTEPWKFIIIQNPVIRESILPHAWGATTQLPSASHFVAILARDTEDVVYHSQYLKDLMQNTQKIPQDMIDTRIEVIKNHQLHDFNLLEHKETLFYWAARQAYIPLANMMTTAAELGIDSCAIEGFNNVQVTKILKETGAFTDGNYHVACLVAFGYREEDPPFPKTRRATSKVIHWLE